MNVSKIWFDQGKIHLLTDDGRTANLSLKAFPRLYNAPDAQRQNHTFSPFGIHWKELDEDLSFEGFFTQKDTAKSDLARLFNSLPEINISQLARVAGINQSLMAKYICGVATPSEGRRKQIEEALHRLGLELQEVSL